MATVQGTGGTISVNGVTLGEVQSWRIEPVPTVCDLSTDPIACAILRQWARQPWAEVHRCALLDRMVELGLEGKREHAQRFTDAFRPGPHSWREHLPRRWVRFRLQMWRLDLMRAFGRFK